MCVRVERCRVTFGIQHIHCVHVNMYRCRAGNVTCMYDIDARSIRMGSGRMFTSRQRNYNALDSHMYVWIHNNTRAY